MKKIIYLLYFIAIAMSMSAQTTYYWKNSVNAPTGAQWSSTSPFYFWNGSADAVPSGGEVIQFDGAGGLVTTNDLAATNRFKINFYSTTASHTINGNTTNVFNDYNGASPLIQNWTSVLQTINFPFQIGNESSNSTSPNYPYGMHIWAGGGDLTIGSTISAANKTGLTKELVLTAGASKTLTMSGEISDGNGTIKMSKWGAGNLLISANNTYTGNTNINEGALWIESTGNITVSNIYLGIASTTVAKIYLSNLSGGTTFTRPININAGNSGTRIIGGLNTSGTNTFSGNIVRSSSQPLTVDVPNAGGSLTLSGTINGSGEFRKIGNGTVTISGTNNTSGTNTSFGGTWMVEQGTLNFSYFGTNLNGKPIILGNATDAGTATYNGTGGGDFATAVSTNAGGGQFNCILNTGSLSLRPATQSQTLLGNLSISVTGLATNILALKYNLGGTGGITLLAGKLTLWRHDTNPVGVNTYSGSTTINAGTLTLGYDNAIPSGAAGVQSAVTINGGTLSTGATSAGFSCGTSTYPMGALTVGASGGTIALAANSSTQNLYFANSSGATWGGGTLTITGWTGTAGSTGTNGKIFIGSDATALTSAQLAKISFAGFTAGAQILPTGEIVPLQTNISSSANTSTLGLSSSTSLTVASNGTLTIDNNSNVNSITLAPGAKLTLGNGNSLTATNGITLQSNATGTATFVDTNNSSPQALNGTVQQYLTAARNWYTTSPITAGTVANLNLGTSVQSYSESAKAWSVLTSSDALVAGKGYVSVAGVGTGTTGTVSFNGTLNTGTISVPVTNSGTDKAGFNLVANPYPSYLDWSLVTADPLNSDIGTTMWVRTKTTGNIYTFATYNSDGNVAVSNNANTTISKFIPPMQAFWIRVNNGISSTNVTFKNSMRAHKDDNANTLKAPRMENRQLLRLQVSNGTNSDEAVVYFHANAQNAFDSYDSQKMFNYNTQQPEIFTQVGTEKLVINGMSELTANLEIPLGFSTGSANNFTLTATELKSLSGTRVMLIDKLNPAVETELSEGTVYNFSAAVTESTINRFSLVFHAPNSVTGIENANDLNKQVFVNNDNQVVIVATEKTNYSIYNAVGMLVENGLLSSGCKTQNSKLHSGIYLVKVNNQTTKVLIK